MEIVDASALIAILLREPSWESVAALIDPNAMVAAESLPLEIGNCLSALVRRNLLSAEMARQTWKGYGSLPIRLLAIPYDVALEIAFEHKIYAYDAYVLALAKQHHSLLITLDQGMARIAKTIGIKVKGV